MKMTVNLYSDVRYTREDISRHLFYRDPIVFIVDDLYNHDSVYSLLNIASDMRKYICVADGYDSPKITSFLASFRDDIESSRVLVTAPVEDRKSVIPFLNDVIRCVRIVNRARGLSVRGAY